jgi:hypothetical protein
MFDVMETRARATQPVIRLGTHQTGYTGHLSIECEGQGGPLLTQSLQWLRTTLAELGIPEEKTDN